MGKDDKYFDMENEGFLDDPEAEIAEDFEVSDEEVAEDELTALKTENRELKDRLLRALADVENMRKRGERDRRDAELYGSTRFARDLLSVHDNFARAMENVSEEARSVAAGLIEGIELTQKDLLSAFQKHKILKVEPEIGEKFDPKIHQAMFEAPVPDTRAGDIIQVMNAGFTIGERLLRPAQVGVSSGGPKKAPEPSEN
jgi:molecular chaperone GrpE